MLNIRFAALLAVFLAVLQVLQVCRPFQFRQPFRICPHPGSTLAMDSQDFLDSQNLHRLCTSRMGLCVFFLMQVYILVKLHQASQY
jgi:hypothetical protein